VNYGKLAGNSTHSDKKKRGPGKPWPKGVSGNPAGRPKSKPITDMLKEIFDDPKEMERIKKNVVETLKSKGMAGVILLNHIADRIEGKVPDEVQITDLRDLPDDELEKRLKALKDAHS
jgi:hypothetical protein